MTANTCPWQNIHSRMMICKLNKSQTSIPALSHKTDNSLKAILTSLKLFSVNLHISAVWLQSPISHPYKCLIETRNRFSRFTVYTANYSWIFYQFNHYFSWQDTFGTNAINISDVFIPFLSIVSLMISVVPTGDVDSKITFFKMRTYALLLQAHSNIRC